MLVILYIYSKIMYLPFLLFLVIVEVVLIILTFFGRRKDWGIHNIWKEKNTQINRQLDTIVFLLSLF